MLRVVSTFMLQNANNALNNKNKTTHLVGVSILRFCNIMWLSYWKQQSRKRKEKHSGWDYFEQQSRRRSQSN